MATLAEYQAVHGTPPRGKTAAIECGDGGCHAIYRRGHLIGRWTSYEVASVALGKLQELTGMFEYNLESFHHWEASGVTKCSKCGISRALDTSPHNQWRGRHEDREIIEVRRMPDEADRPRRYRH